jgi:hypothetical protein
MILAAPEVILAAYGGSSSGELAPEVLRREAPGNEEVKGRPSHARSKTVPHGGGPDSVTAIHRRRTPAGKVVLNVDADHRPGVGFSH